MAAIRTWFMNPSVLGFIFPLVIWSKRQGLITKGKKVFNTLWIYSVVKVKWQQLATRMRTHSTQMIPSHTTFGLDMGPSDPNNNGPELGFPDTNIYLLLLIFFFLCFQAYYVVWYLKASISFKLIFSWLFYYRPFYSYGWKRGWGWPCFDTNLLCFVMVMFLRNTSKHKNNLIFIIKQEGLYQNKVTLSLATVHNCKMAYCM